MKPYHLPTGPARVHAEDAVDVPGVDAQPLPGKRGLRQAKL